MCFELENIEHMHECVVRERAHVEHTHKHTHSHALSPSITHTHTLARARIHTHTHTYTHVHTPSLSLSRLYALTRTNTQTHPLTHPHTHIHVHTYTDRPRIPTQMLSCPPTWGPRVTLSSTCGPSLQCIVFPYPQSSALRSSLFLFSKFLERSLSQ